MNAWEIIFIQSKVNNSVYNGDSLLNAQLGMAPGNLVPGAFASSA